MSLFVVSFFVFLIIKYSGDSKSGLVQKMVEKRSVVKWSGFWMVLCRFGFPTWKRTFLSRCEMIPVYELPVFRFPLYLTIKLTVTLKTMKGIWIAQIRLVHNGSISHVTKHYLSCPPHLKMVAFSSKQISLLIRKIT